MSTINIPRALPGHEIGGKVAHNDELKQNYNDRNDAIVRMLDRGFDANYILRSLQEYGWKTPRNASSIATIAHQYKVRVGRLIPKHYNSKTHQIATGQLRAPQTAELKSRAHMDVISSISEMLEPIIADAQKWRQLQNMMEN